MRTYLDLVERRWRSLAMNKKAAIKVRKTAIQKMKFPTDAFLCRLLKAVKGRPSLEFLVVERLAQLRSDAFNRLLNDPPAKEPK